MSGSARGRYLADRAASSDALRAALAACASLRRADPALCTWIEQGHPRLTEAEHARRFGGPYTVTRKKGG